MLGGADLTGIITRMTKEWYLSSQFFRYKISNVTKIRHLLEKETKKSPQHY
jgi:hypothetical protein